MSVFTLYMHNNDEVQATDQRPGRPVRRAAAARTWSATSFRTTYASKPKTGIVGTVVGVVIALFGASGVFGSVAGVAQHDLGRQGQAGPGIMGYVKSRFISFGMVGGVCFLLLVSVTVTAGSSRASATSSTTCCPAARC